jgi:hypothetical protein
MGGMGSEPRDVDRAPYVVGTIPLVESTGTDPRHTHG